MAIAVSVAVPAAFADAPVGVATQADKAPRLTLNDDITYKYTSGPFGGRDFEVGLWAGSYVLEKSDAEGSYYLATKPSFWWKAGGKYVLFNAAGLFVPKDPIKQTRIYFYNYAGHIVASSDLNELREKAKQPPAPAAAEAGANGSLEPLSRDLQERLPGGGGYTARGILAVSLTAAVIQTLIEAAGKGPMLHQVDSPDFTRLVRERSKIEE